MVAIHFVILGILVVVGLLLQRFGYITAGPKLGPRQRIALAILLVGSGALLIANNFKQFF